MDLSCKRVLFIAPLFFGYEQEIINELIKCGAEVDFLLDRPFSSPFMKGLTRINRQLVMGFAKHYYENELNRFARTHYDLIFVINGQTLSPNILSEWRRSFPQATFVLYLWDSLKNRQIVLKNLNFFDFCFSFDKNDSLEFNLYFRPLFFSRGFECSATLSQDNTLYDMSFIGTAHSDRYALVSKLSSRLSEKTSFFYYLYLQAKWVYFYYKLTNTTFKMANIQDFNFDALDKHFVQNVFAQSKTILDIEHPQQSGLTMRTLETLGAKKKLVTTNKNICDYDFYCPENICVLDRSSPAIQEKFFSDPYNAIDPILYHKYRIDGWLNEILCKVHSCA